MEYEIDFRSSQKKPAKRLLWLTDIHLDAAEKEQYKLFFEYVVSFECDGLLVGGDVCNGSNAFKILSQFAQFANKPLYFILGNHDFYYSSIAATRRQAVELSRHAADIHYLSNKKIIKLAAHSALIGHDGWSDGLAGDFLNSDIMLNDYMLIDELKLITPEERLLRLNNLGKEAADYLKKTLEKALEKFQRVLLLTHVPPFHEACVRYGVPYDDNWSPHFVGKSVGIVLEEIMKAHPEKHLLVLCGHSHNGNEIDILPNLRVLTGQCELGAPSIQGIVLIN